MKIALFIPCYVNQFYPQVAIATLEVLEKCGVSVAYPEAQTCCGQPLGNAGYEQQSVEVCELFVKTFQEYAYIVAPSGSCVHHVKHHFNMLPQTEAVQKVRNTIYEFSEFLVKVLKVTRLGAKFPYRVGLHQSCHGLRGLRLGPASELRDDHYPVVEALLKEVEGLEQVPLDRADECCGFGGTFAVTQAAVSVAMGRDRIGDHLRNKAQVITATDMSCLMHLEGLIRKDKIPVKVMHLAEILNSTVV